MQSKPDNNIPRGICGSDMYWDLTFQWVLSILKFRLSQSYRFFVCAAMCAGFATSCTCEQDARDSFAPSAFGVAINGTRRLVDELIVRNVDYSQRMVPGGYFRGNTWTSSVDSSSIDPCFSEEVLIKCGADLERYSYTSTVLLPPA
jgi:hypothetical protein